jgi:hypothetical protein
MMQGSADLAPTATTPHALQVPSTCTGSARGDFACIWTRLFAASVRGLLTGLATYQLDRRAAQVE